MRLAVMVCALVVLLSAGCANQRRYVVKSDKTSVKKQAFFDYRLDNGMRVLVHERKSGGPTAVQLWVGGGSLADPEGKAGLGHFVEHMLFSGAKGLSLDGVGRSGETIESLGGRVNGQTGRDYSYIGITLPGEGWKKAVDVLYGMCCSSPVFDEKEVESEKKTVADELRDRQLAPDIAALEELFDVAYEKHPYRRPVAGTPESVMSFTVEDAVAHYGNLFVPSNMTLVVSGDVRPLSVKALAGKTFGKMTAAKPVFPENEPEPYQISIREKHVESDTRLSYMAMGWHICEASEKDIYALDALRAVLGLGRGSQLSMNIKERRRLVVDISAELFAMREPGMFVITAKLKGEDVKRATEERLKELNDIKQNPVEGFRLRDAAKAVESWHVISTRDAEGQAFALGYWATVYGWGDQPDYIDNITEVTPADLQRVAQKYIGEGNYTLVVVGPEEDVEE